MQNRFSKPIGGIQYIQCFMLIILDIGLADYGIRLDHKLISFDWRHVNENFQKMEFWKKTFAEQK